MDETTFSMTPEGAARIREMRDQKNQEGQPKKKHHRLRNFFIIFGVIIFLLAFGVAATGLYQVPFISSIFGFNKPKDLGVKTSSEALVSLKEHVPLKIDNDTVDYSVGPDKVFSGQMNVDTTITDSELTSWLERFEGNDPIFTDTQVKRYEGGIEISTMLKKYVETPIYLKVDIARTSNKSVSLNIQKAKLGMFSVPDKYKKQAQDWLQDRVNHMMETIPGFSVEKFELHPGYSIFKGTMPSTVKKSEQGWSGLLAL